MKIPEEYKKLYYLFSQKERLKFMMLFFMMLLVAVLEVAGIGMIPAFVGIVADPEQIMKSNLFGQFLQSYGILSSRVLLLWGSVVLVGVFILKNLYLVAYFYIESRFVCSRMYDIARRLMSCYMKAPYVFHLQRNTAELLRNTIEESKLLIEQVVLPGLIVVREGVMGFSIMLFLLIIEPFITLVVFLVLGSAIGTFLFFTQKQVKLYGKKEQGYRREMIKAVNQGLGGIKDARILNREDNFIEQFRLSASNQSKLRAYQKFVAQIPKPIVETVAVLGIMLIALLMVWQGRPINAIIPILSLFAMATVRLMPAINQIANNYTRLRYNLVSIHPIYNDIQELSESQDRMSAERNKKEIFEFSQELDVKNVYYHYPNSSEYVLNGVSFTLQKGQAIAFIGASGAGKTTIVDLILGLMEPTAGTIKVDGTNIMNNLSAWQKNIGYIAQTIYLSDEPLRNNIAFGMPEEDIDDEKVWKAVRLAQLEELVVKMPRGLDTVIGERGTLLSGGQQQRVGIARALYHDPKILVMDEATSALDNITEKYIMDSIELLKKERTIIMIAHRLTTVKNCDILYIMKDGKIIESGNYDELLKRSKEFQNMNPVI